MKYKNYTIGALVALSGLVLISPLNAAPIYIENQHVDLEALPDIRGVKAINELPLLTTIGAREVERSLTDLSLTELGMVSTGGTAPGSDDFTVSSPIVASYNVPSNSGTLPNSINGALPNRTTNTPATRPQFEITEVNNQSVKRVLSTRYPGLLMDGGENVQSSISVGDENFAMLRMAPPSPPVIPRIQRATINSITITPISGPVLSATASVVARPVTK
jgi:hypothetical protein